MTPLEWALSDDTGISSKTILSVMEGMPAPKYGCDVPHDSGDFGRCHRLLKAFPHYRARLHEVAEKYPAWVALVREWDRLAALYETNKTGMHEAMRPLIDEGRVADGWVQTGRGSWRKGNHANVRIGDGVSIGF